MWGNQHFTVLITYKTPHLVGLLHSAKVLHLIIKLTTMTKQKHNSVGKVKGDDKGKLCLKKW